MRCSSTLFQFEDSTVEFALNINLGYDVHYRDSFHEQEGCRIHYDMQDSLCAGWHAISIELASVLIDTNIYTFLVLPGAC